MGVSGLPPPPTPPTVPLPHISRPADQYLRSSFRASIISHSVAPCNYGQRSDLVDPSITVDPVSAPGGPDPVSNNKSVCHSSKSAVSIRQLDCSHLRAGPVSESSRGEEKCKSDSLVSKVDVVVSGPPRQVHPRARRTATDLKTIKRIPQSSSPIILPTVININPRSLYGRQDSLAEVIEEYEGEIVTVSESWNREDDPLTGLIDIEDFEMFMNVKQREQRGGKPLILVNTKKYSVRKLCPNIVTVPSSVEAVWILVTANNEKKKVPMRIAICSFYFSPTVSSKDEFLDHFAETIQFLKSKYDSSLHLILSGDNNRLDLQPILDLSPDLHQVVKVPTRLHPPATLDVIVTTLSDYYESPVAKPPIGSDQVTGKPSDHLIVLWRPLPTSIQKPERVYRSVICRPYLESGIAMFGSWLTCHDWHDMYQMRTLDEKVDHFQRVLVEKYHEFFPTKICKFSQDDKPWFTSKLKGIDRRKKREYQKNHKSPKYLALKSEYKDCMKKDKARYYKDIVIDLKKSDPKKWYSKLKRMTGKHISNTDSPNIQELHNIEPSGQPDVLATHFAQTRNLFEPVKSEDF